MVALPVVAASCNEVTGVSAIEIVDGYGGGSAYVPTDEPCDVDGEFEPCYPGPPTTRGIGPCADGARLCIGGFWSQCANAVVPVQDVCDDGIDNDCDGASDEGCPCVSGTDRTCYSGSPTTLGIGACRAGVQDCVDEVWSTACTGEVAPAQEYCNGNDDNCNGVPDDDCLCLGTLAQDTCTSAEDLGDVDVGGDVLGPIGQIQTPDDSDWYMVGFPPAATGPGGGEARITFAQGEANGYRFDVYLDCSSTTPLNCDGDTPADTITDWSFVDDQSLAGDLQWSTRDVPWPTLVYVRVHRPGGDSCDDYQLSVTR